MKKKIFLILLVISICLFQSITVFCATTNYTDSWNTLLAEAEKLKKANKPIYNLTKNDKDTITYEFKGGDKCGHGLFNTTKYNAILFLKPNYVSAEISFNAFLSNNTNAIAILKVDTLPSVGNAYTSNTGSLNGKKFKIISEPAKLDFLTCGHTHNFVYAVLIDDEEFNNLVAEGKRDNISGSSGGWHTDTKGEYFTAVKTAGHSPEKIYNQFICINDNSYNFKEGQSKYLGSNGYVMKNTPFGVNNTVYVADNLGICRKTGWFQLSDGRWEYYIYNSDYQTKTNRFSSGWKQIDGVYYYFNGVMIAGEGDANKTQFIDGKNYSFDKDGHCIAPTINNPYLYNPNQEIKKEETPISDETSKTNETPKEETSKTVDNTNKKAPYYSVYPKISSGKWMGTSGKYWFKKDVNGSDTDPNNYLHQQGEDKSGTWFYIDCDGGSKGWGGYYYIFDANGYWNPQIYAIDDPQDSNNWVTWNGETPGGTSDGSGKGNGGGSGETPKLENDNKNKEKDKGYIKASGVKGGGELNREQTQAQVNLNSTESLNMAAKLSMLDSINNNNITNLANTPVAQQPTQNNTEKANVIIPSGNDNATEGGTEVRQNTANEEDAEAISEYMTGKQFNDKDSIYKSTGTLSWNPWFELDRDDYEEIGNYDGYALKSKISGSNSGKWVPYNQEQTEWMFITKTGTAKIYYTDENDKKHTVDAYGVEEYLEDGVYLIGTSSGNYQLYEFEEGITKSEPISNIKFKASGEAQNYTPKIEDSEIGLTVYDNDNIEYKNSKYYTSYEGSKDCTNKLLGDGYFILKKSDTLYNLIKVDTNGKPTTVNSTKLKTAYDIQEYLNKGDYSEAYELTEKCDDKSKKTISGLKTETKTTNNNDTNTNTTNNSTTNTSNDITNALLAKIKELDQKVKEDDGYTFTWSTMASKMSDKGIEMVIAADGTSTSLSGIKNMAIEMKKNSKATADCPIDAAITAQLKSTKPSDGKTYNQIIITDKGNYWVLDSQYQILVKTVKYILGY